MGSNLTKSICVYCGSAVEGGTEFANLMLNYGRFLATNHITLIYGGSRFGLMGRLADGSLDRGGQVIGIMPQHRVSRELAHPRLSELIIVASMHDRKAEMARRADVFVAFPGGFGTLDELFEIITWRQLGLHSKTILIANLNGYWDDVLAQVGKMHAFSFFDVKSKDLIQICNTFDVFVNTTLLCFEKN